MRSITISMIAPYTVRRKKEWGSWFGEFFDRTHIGIPAPTAPAALRLMPFFVGSAEIDLMGQLMKGEE